MVCIAYSYNVIRICSDLGLCVLLYLLKCFKKTILLVKKFLDYILAFSIKYSKEVFYFLVYKLKHIFVIYFICLFFQDYLKFCEKRLTNFQQNLFLEVNNLCLANEWSVCLSVNFFLIQLSELIRIV